MEQQEVARYVQQGLERYWSPEQIAGRSCRDFARTPDRQVGRQTIYNWIAQERARGDNKWAKCLRHANKRRRHRKPSSMAAKSIAGRPAVVDRRSRYGDWEGDTVVGVRHRGAIITNVERKSGYLLANKVTDRNATGVKDTLVKQFGELPTNLCRTITFDRGKEFSEFESLAEETKVAVYFADPYCSWQRGTNENTNGLLRQFFPKGTDFTQVAPRQVARATRLLNERPRKRLHYRTPSEVLSRFFHCCV
jgi:IS30 family transposase